MYLTGTKYNLEDRIHQLPTGASDLQSFRTEYSGYSLETLEAYKITVEIDKKSETVE